MLYVRPGSAFLIFSNRKKASIGETGDGKKRDISTYMNKQTKQRATLQQLRSLANQPAEQARYALGLLELERGRQVASEALTVITNSPVTEGRPLLLRLYEYYDAAGVKRDAGGDLRIAILGALLPIADSEDRALAERAITTYEFMPPKREECAGGLRAAGLVLLSDLDPVLASFHCTRLLVDIYTSRMSGEPAVSAVRLLTRQVSHLPYQGHLLPLYSYIFDQHKCHPEVEAECLRQLAKAPTLIVENILSHYTALISIGTGTPVPRHETKDDVALLGLFDLLLANSNRRSCLSFIEKFLCETRRYEVYHYLVTAIIANHSPQALKVLVEVAQNERRPEKIELLLSALTLLQHDPTIGQLIRKLQQKKEQIG